MPITLSVRDRIAEIVFDVPPVNAFDSVSTPWRTNGLMTARKRNLNELEATVKYSRQVRLHANNVRRSDW